MESIYVCTVCRLEHTEPAHAGLGIRVICHDCAFEAEIVAFSATADEAGDSFRPPVAA